MGRLHARSFLLAAAAVAAALVCSSGPAHVAAAAAAAESSSELVLVYSIQRHGARNVLPKSADLRESDAAGGPTLLLAGRQQCHAAGRAFRARYISRPSCAAAAPPLCLSAPGAEQYGVINSRGVGFHNYNTVANSSALDRTIMSAGAFLAGVFAASAAGSSGGGQVVPVYSVSEGNDWLIRGYAHCPAYRRRLSAWLAGQEFAAQADATAQLRSKVQQLAPQLNTSLATWWDVYDSFNVWRSYGVGTPMPALDNATFAQVVELAMWLETAKMAPELTNNLLGGGLLGDVLARMAAAADATSSSSQAPYFKLVSVSSHYNTQLGVLAALQAAVPPSQRSSHAWQAAIPSLAAVLAFELHRDGASGGYVVRAVAHDSPQAGYVVLPLPCARAGDAAEALAGPGSCTLEAFRALAGPQAINSSSHWCEACDNTRAQACQLHSMQRQLSAVADGSRGGRYVSPGMVAVWCMVSVAAAGLLAGLAAVGVRGLQQRRRRKAGLAFDVGAFAAHGDGVSAAVLPDAQPLGAHNHL